MPIYRFRAIAQPLRLVALTTMLCAFRHTAAGQVLTAPSATTPLGSGPYRAVMEADPGLKTHTVYHPADLASVSNQKLPIVLWGNGACANEGNRFRWFLSDIASYGYLVVAIGPIVPGIENWAPQAEGPPAVAPANPTTPAFPPAKTHSSQLIDAMNWAIAENSRVDSQYFHRLDVTKIAVMGQSCGGVQAIEASADPRVTTSMVWNSGLFNTPTQMGGGKLLTREDLKLLHAPTAYISGDPSDIAFSNANADYELLNNIPIFRGYEFGIPHSATYSEHNGGEYAGVAVAWLNWRLKDDAKSAKMFVGQDCGLCVNPRWVVRKKKID